MGHKIGLGSGAGADGWSAFVSHLIGAKNISFDMLKNMF